MYENLFKSPLQRVFVYGTLKRGEPNHGLIASTENGYAKFLGLGKTLAKFPLIIATKYNIPFMLKKPGVGNVSAIEMYNIYSSCKNFNLYLSNILIVLYEIKMYLLFSKLLVMFMMWIRRC